MNLVTSNTVTASSQAFGNLTIINGEKGLLFIGKEVAEMLGYVDTDQAIRKNCKKSETRQLDGFGNRGVKIIPESDVYRLIIKSKLPSAEAFEEWVMEEVLPEIRKTGSYNPVKAQDSYMIEDPIARAKRWIEEAEEKKVLTEEVKALQPKAELLDQLVETGGMFDIGTVAKMLDVKIGRNTLFKRLRSEGIFFSDRNEPKQQHVSAGRFVVKQVSVNFGGFKGIQMIPKVYVTNKGVEYINKKLK